MMHLLPFLGITALLLFEGYCALTLFCHKPLKRSVRIALALPIATFLNLLLFFILTVLSLPLTPTIIWVCHGTITLILLLFIILQEPYEKVHTELSVHNFYSSLKEGANRAKSTLNNPLVLLCSLILVGSFLYATSHALLLPTYHYDSATNWNHRAKVSYIEKKIVFASSEEQGIRKPQYPFLYHALAIAAQQGQDTWSDRAANAMHFLLTLSCLIALFLLLRTLKGTLPALLCITILIGTPLFTLHLGQSYADVPLTLFALLSLVSFMCFSQTLIATWLHLSAFFIAACVWTKSEGLPLCLLSWLAVVFLFLKQNPVLRRPVVSAVLLALALSLPWPLFSLLLGLNITPHGVSDITLHLNPMAVSAFVDSLFIQGSFGILWYVLFTALCSIFIAVQKGKTHTLDRPFIYPLLFGLLTLLGYSCIYLLTENAQYLISGQSFDRQLLLPSALLLVPTILCLTPKRSD